MKAFASVYTYIYASLIVHTIDRTMKFTKQREAFNVSDTLDKFNIGKCGKRKHSPLLPDSIRCLICGPSNCGKTNLMFNLLINPKGLRFANLYIYSKSFQQPKYKLLEQLIKSIPEIGYFAYDNSDDVKSPADCKSHSVMIFDDVACDPQDHMRAYFSMGRHRDIDCFYLTQTYTRVPKHLLRDNANMVVLFKMDNLNMKHVFDEHVDGDMSFNQFKELCSYCWNKSRHGFVVISKDDGLNDGRYRCGLDTYVTNI
jgi:hypothetical protein